MVPSDYSLLKAGGYPDIPIESVGACSIDGDVGDGVLVATRREAVLHRWIRQLMLMDLSHVKRKVLVDCVIKVADRKEMSHRVSCNLL